VKYRIGQVVKHKRWGYRGVIVGWDEFAKVSTKVSIISGHTYTYILRDEKNNVMV
jgi:hemimethylated DNA binding protein